MHSFAFILLFSNVCVYAIERNGSRLDFGRIMESTDKDYELSFVSNDMNKINIRYICYQIGGKRRAELDVTDDKITVENLPLISVVEFQMKERLWYKKVLGRVSPWIDTEHKNPRIQELSLKALEEELDYIDYLGIRAVVLPLKHQYSPNLIKLLNRKLWGESAYYEVWITVSTDVHSLIDQKIDSCSADKDDKCDNLPEVWSIWREFRTQLFNHNSLYVMLDFSEELPDEFVRENAKNRWLGEPLAGLLFDFDLFHIDAKTTKMSLPESHIRLIERYVAIDPEPTMLITDKGKTDLTGLSERVKYIRRIYSYRSEDFLGAHLESYSRPYVMLNFHFMANQYTTQDYVTLERSSRKKYEMIRDTTIEVLEEMIREKQLEDKEVPEFGILVIGAGKGPLITQVAFEAERRLKAMPDLPKFRLHISAVEINQNAALTLKFRNATEWKRVDVYGGDIANYRTEKKFDVAIGDLFGGLGDVQMMPEIVDSAKHLLKATGVNIPRKCTSYIAPIHAIPLYNQIRKFRRNNIWSANPDRRNPEKPKDLYINSWTSRNPNWDNFDQIYIASLQCSYMISEPKQLFSFDLPSWEGQEYTKEAKITFDVTEDTEVMGLAGFFECDHSETRLFSILPQSHSDELTTYDPNFFPFRKPILVKKGENLTVHIKRMSDDVGMWYEWNLVEPIETEVQNLHGASYLVKKKLLDN